MNIPYADFYKAELGENDAAVDAVTSSTKSKPRGTLAKGSYHKNEDGSDISGVIYPVFVKDKSVLEGLTEVTDESSLSITVTNRGQETTTEYKGKDALFESEDYSYYKLTDKPAYYKTLEAAEDGTKSFSAVSGRASKVETASGEVNEAGHHAEVEITLKDTTGIETGQAVSGAVVTFEDGSKVGLRHIVELWRATEIGGSAAQFAGKKITNIRYYTQEAVIDFPMEIDVKKKAADAAAEFTDAHTIQLSGLPEDLENAKATVQTQVGRGETATVIATDAEIKDGVITTADAAEGGKTYAIAISSDNYLRINTTAEYCLAKQFKDVDVDQWYHDGIDYAVANGMMKGMSEDTFEPETATTRAMIVTILYRLEGEPDAAASSFKDVESGKWYEKAVNWAAANEIVKGYSADQFGPNDLISREQMATILYRYADYKGADVTGAVDLSSFTDSSAVSTYAVTPMAWAVNVGLIQGTSTSQPTLEPQGKATRAQVATLMMRFCEKVLKL